LLKIRQCVISGFANVTFWKTWPDRQALAKR
jgi:hypothetical protein